MNATAGVAWASVWGYVTHAWDVTGTSPIVVYESTEITIGHTYAIIVSQDCQLNYTDENKNRYSFSLLANVPGMEANEVVWNITSPYVRPPSWWESIVDWFKEYWYVVGIAVVLVIILVFVVLKK